MELNFEMQLPRWNQGDEHWVITALKQWFSLPAWTVEQAASLLVSINPKSKTDGELTLINGASISLHTDNLQEKELLVSIPRIRDDILEAAAAHGIERLSPKEWITFAESIGVSPSWKSLAISNSLLILPVEKLSTEELDNVAAPTADAGSADWVANARAIADQVSLEKWNCGIREISARSICDEVARRLNVWGCRGIITGSTVRKISLKGWKFKPPCGANGANGAAP
jgi:hypothetical protein